MGFNWKVKFNIVNTREIGALKDALNKNEVSVAENNGTFICEYRLNEEETYFSTYCPADGQVRAMKLNSDDKEESLLPGLHSNMHRGTTDDPATSIVLLGAMLPEILKSEESKDLFENHPEKAEQLAGLLFSRMSGTGKTDDIKIPKVIEEVEGSISEDNGKIPRVTMNELRKMFPNNIVQGTEFQVLTPESNENELPDDLNGYMCLMEEPAENAFTVDWNKQELVEGAMTIAKMVKASPRMRNFAIRGGSGTGKTTLSEHLAALLGLPRYVFSCFADLDATALKGTYTPRISSVNLGEIEKERAPMPIFKSIVSALKALAEKKNITYELYKTALIEGLENPGVLEIQEPNTVANPAVLNLLNSITDSCGKGQIQLDDGTIIHRHPDSIIVYTWNPGYAGTMDLSASILDRVNFHIEMNTPSAEVLAARAKKQFPTADPDVIDQMAKVVRAAADYIEREDITTGNASQRQLDSWVDAVFNCGLGVAEAFEGTVLMGSSQDPEDRVEIRGCFDASPLASKKKKRVNKRGI